MQRLETLASLGEALLAIVVSLVIAGGSRGCFAAVDEDVATECPYSAARASGDASGRPADT